MRWTGATRTSENPVKVNFAERLTAEVRRIPLPETVWKVSAGVMVAYALRYGEQEIPHGSLSDSEWLCIGPHLPPAPQDKDALGFSRLTGDPRDAVFYVLKSGCPWRLLPRDFPPWKTVYDWFRSWRIDGRWERLNTELRERLRTRLGRNPQPPAPR